MISVLIQLTSAGADTGPFEIYALPSNTFLGTVDKITLQNYGVTVNVPDDTTVIRVTSIGGCTNHVDVIIDTPPPTTSTSTSTSSTSSTTSTTSSTSTSTTTLPPTTTTTTTIEILPLNTLINAEVGVPNTTIDYSIQLSNTTGAPITYRLRLENVTQGSGWHVGPQHIVAPGAFNELHQATITAFGVGNVNGDTINAELSNDDGGTWVASLVFDPPYILPYAPL